MRNFGELKRLLDSLEPEASAQAELLEHTLCSVSAKHHDYLTHHRPSFDQFMAEFKELPGGYCTFTKATIAALLTKSMTPSYVAKMCSVPESTLRAYIKDMDTASRLADKKKEEAATAPPPSQKRQSFTNWASINAPVKSGSINRRFLKWSTFVDAHLAFQEHCQLHNAECVVLSTFILYCRADRIKRMGWDRYLCSICCDAKAADARGEEMDQPQKDHVALIPLQWKHWKDDVAALETCHNQIVAVHDFSTVHEAAGYKVRVLSLCLFYWDEESQEVVRSFFDYVSDHKGDWAFVRFAWQKVIADFGQWPRFKSVVVWSDNGLKSKENLFFFYKWANKISKSLEFELKYWAPQHGHSECDRHFGQLKLKTRRQYAGHCVAKDESALEQILEIALSLPGTNAMATKAKGISDRKPDVDPVVGIRSYFYFIKLDDNQYQARLDCSRKNGILVTMSSS